MSGLLEFLRCRVLRSDLLAGRAEALDDLFALLAAPLYHHALSVTRNVTDAEEVLQEVFLELVRDPQKLRGVKDLKPYLFRAIRNRALNRTRQPAAEPLIDIPASEADRDEAMALQQALDGLAEEQREVVVMKTYQGLTFQEIGAILNIPAATAASRYRYALEHLRRQLGETP